MPTSSSSSTAAISPTTVQALPLHLPARNPRARVRLWPRPSPISTQRSSRPTSTSRMPPTRNTASGKQAKATLLPLKPLSRKRVRRWRRASSCRQPVWTSRRDSTTNWSPGLEPATTRRRKPTTLCWTRRRTSSTCSRRGLRTPTRRPSSGMKAMTSWLRPSTSSGRTPTRRPPL